MTEKIKIRVIALGSIPPDVELSKVVSHKSSLFEIMGDIKNYPISTKADGNNWEFTDKNISTMIPNIEGHDVLIVLTVVPLENGWYSRRVKENVVAFSFHEISHYLRYENIPIVNVVFRLLYAYTLVYLEYKKRIPSCEEYTNFTHDDIRGCLFDMNGYDKFLITISCVSPTVCDQCKHRLAEHMVATSDIEKVKKEIRAIRKKLFYRISGLVEKHPYFSITIASIWAVLIGLLAEFGAHIIW